MGTAVVMLSESAPKPLLAQSGPVMSLGSQCGFLAALSVTTGLTALLSPAQMLQWGWRVPFLLASLPGALTIWYAYGAHESEEFEGAPDAPRCCEGPALVCMAENLDTTVWDHWRSGLLACVSVSGAGGVGGGGCGVDGEVERAAGPPARTLGKPGFQPQGGGGGSIEPDRMSHRGSIEPPKTGGGVREKGSIDMTIHQLL